MKKKFTRVLLIICLILTLNFSTVFAQNVDLSRLNELIDVIHENYKDDVSNEKLIDGAIKGILETLDPHSIYLTKKEYEDLLNSLNGEFSGIGVSIKKVNNYIEVIEVIKNSPAEESGLKKGDKFVSVDRKDVIDIEIDVFVSMVRGPKGTKVKVEVLRGNSQKPINFEITRDEISIESVEYKIIEHDIGYIKISNFSDNSFDEVMNALKEFDNENVGKVIVDLRGNPGGYLSEVVQMSRFFIPEGPIVHIKKNNQELETYSSYLENSKYSLAVLVNEGSASASEIFAGAVQDSKVGTIIGKKTFGKGTVQTFFKLNNGDYVKLSIAKYLTPNKRSIDGVGLTPDIIIESNNIIDEVEPMNISRNIYLGREGKDVLAVEQRLYQLGYISQNPDETYDFKTRNAVVKFKKENNLLVNSTITKVFQRTLEEEFLKGEIQDLQLQKAIEVLN